MMRPLGYRVGLPSSWDHPVFLPCSPQCPEGRWGQGLYHQFSKVFSNEGRIPKVTCVAEKRREPCQLGLGGLRPRGKPSRHCLSKEVQVCGATTTRDSQHPSAFTLLLSTPEMFSGPGTTPGQLHQQHILKSMGTSRLS